MFPPINVRTDVSHTNRTPSSREEASAWLAERIAESGVQPTVVEGFKEPVPRPPRSDKVDPETRLARRSRRVPASVLRELEEMRRELAQQRQILEIIDMIGGEE